MKKLTFALIAVFLFPASFALGGEHPAFANERPSLVNDDLAFAFHGDVPLQAQFLSEEEMQEIGEGLPVLAYLLLDLAVTFKTGQPLEGHYFQILRRTWAYMKLTEYDLETELGPGEPPKSISESIKNAEIQRLQTHKNASIILEGALKAFSKAVKDHIKQVELDMESDDRRYREDFYNGSEDVADYLTNQIITKVRAKLTNMLHSKTSKPTSTSTTTPSKFLPTGGWLLEEEGEDYSQYSQDVRDQLILPLSDGHIYSLYGHSFGGIGVQTGSSYGNRTGGYQTGYCVGNTCTVTWHYRPRRGSRSPSVSRPSPSVSRQPTNVSLF